MLHRLLTTRPFVAAAGLILVSELFLVLSGLSIRQVSENLHTTQIVFLRNLLGLALLLPWLIRNGTRATKTGVLRFHFMRAAVGVTAMTCLFYSWANLPLAQAALLKQTAPFFTPLIALWWLREHVSGVIKWSLALGFLGVFIVLNPQEGTLNLAAVIALAGALMSALAKVTVRRLAISEGPQRIVFYFALFSALISAIPAFFHWVAPTMMEMTWLITLATTSTLAQLFLSKGYSLAPAGQLGPFTYASIPFAALLGWMVWDQALDWNTLIGIVLVFAAGMLAMRPESQGDKAR